MQPMTIAKTALPLPCLPGCFLISLSASIPIIIAIGAKIGIIASNPIYPAVTDNPVLPTGSKTRTAALSPKSDSGCIGCFKKVLQCLHFMAEANISSLQYGHRIFCSELHAVLLFSIVLLALRTFSEKYSFALMAAESYWSFHFSLSKDSVGTNSTWVSLNKT